MADRLGAGVRVGDTIDKDLVASVDRTALLSVTNGTLAQESFQIRAKP